MIDQLTISDSRPGLGAWAQLILHEARMVIRDTAGLVIPFGLPVLILVMSGLGAESQGIPELGGMSEAMAYIIPMVSVMIIAIVGVINMPSFLASYRRYKMLRRLAVTPASPAMVLVAQVVVGLAQSVIGIAIAIIVGAVVFDVAAPLNLPGALVAVALTITAMFAIGMLIAAISPTTNAAIAIGMVTFFALMALGGGFGPRENLPDALASVGEYLPFGAGLEALHAAWTGETVQMAHVGVLAAVTVVFGATSAKLFRWE